MCSIRPRRLHTLVAVLVVLCKTFPFVAAEHNSMEEVEGQHVASFCNQYNLEPRSQPRRIFDGFIFFNELDLLEVRLEELYDVVEKFVLLESAKTFTFKDKPLNFAENKWRYSKYLDKMWHFVVELSPDDQINCTGDNCQHWTREREQRDKIAVALAQSGAKPTDIALISDCDEIIPRSVALALAQCELELPITIPSEVFYYNFDWRFTFENGAPFVHYHPQAAEVAHAMKFGADYVAPFLPLHASLLSDSRH